MGEASLTILLTRNFWPSRDAAYSDPTNLADSDAGASANKATGLPASTAEPFTTMGMAIRRLSDAT